MLLNHYLTRDDDEIPITIEFDYTPAHPGEREPGTGLRLDPGNEEEVEICEVRDQHGNSLELTKAEINSLELFCLESLEQMRAEDRMENSLEAEYERLRQGY